MFSESTISIETFQKDYWRKVACTLGQVDVTRLEGLSFLDLTLLALEPEVESRLLTPISTPSGNGFDLQFGPFDQLNMDGGQMLMIQNLESFSFELSKWLSEHFSFLPRWRIEDVMATLANQGGSCGAHFDQYDVFLVQLCGEKTWQLDAGGHDASDLDETSEIRLLKAFTPTQELQQRPGDVLYIPPGVGHHGIASDNSITLSVGIRNPLMNEMASHLADRLLMAESRFSLSDHFSGAVISMSEVEQLGRKLLAEISNQDLISRWYGCYMTEPRDPELLNPDGADYSIDEIRSWLGTVTTISLDLPTRIAFQPGTLFINGESFELHTGALWLEQLQQQREIEPAQIPDGDEYVLQILISTAAVLT